MSSITEMQGRRVLITAGAAGLGRAMLEAFHRAGARLFICDVSEQALRSVGSALPDVRSMVADVSEEDQVDRLFSAVADAWQGLDVLVNNAGIAGPTGYVETLSKADWDRTLAVNITGQFLCARAAVPLLKASPNAAMINMSSAAGHLAFAGRSAYSASKWAVVGFTKTLAAELGRHGVRVNAILPGAVEGERIRRVIAAKAETLGRPVEEVARAYESQAALGRMAEPADIANLAVFLASDAARSISGQAIAVDGHTEKLI